MTNLKLLVELDRIHPYPAKYTVSMIEEIILKYSKQNDTILDPFCGAGTTLLASRYLNRNSIGFDINPIGYLISRVKSIDYSKYKYEDFLLPSKEDLVKFASEDNFYYESINHWFSKDAITALSAIKSWINEINDLNIRELFLLAFSHIINSVSNQESDTRYVAKIQKDTSVDEIFKKFIDKSTYFVNLVISFKGLNATSKVYLDDSKNISKHLLENSIDFIITSPPYPNTYDYYLYHKHRMIWIGHDYKITMNSEIGSRREFSSLKRKAEKFSQDLEIILNECVKVLKKHGHMCLIIGDGMIAGQIYDSKQEIEIISKKLDLKIVEYSYVNLDDTSRSFTKTFRTKGKKEHFIVLKKGE